MYKFVKSASATGKMMSYGDQRLNSVCARTKLGGFVMDEVIAHPDLQGFDINRRRTSPIRLGIGVSKEDALILAKDLVANIHKYHFTNDVYEVDALLF